MNRDWHLDRVRSETQPWDILIVGGGATGLGCAVDSAARGHRTLLVEQADFAKATSSRSTKLVHGGVRYLRQGNIALVLEALRERGLLVQNAPHLVHNMAFVIPNYHWWEGPFYGIGMKVYDQLAGKLGLAASKTLSREEVLDRIPTIEPEGMTGGVIYHDGQFDDSRLAINLAQSAETCGASVLNYVRCCGLIKENDVVCGVELKDEESGEEFSVRARCVVNATGVFADTLRRQDDADAGNLIAVSQGIHIVLPKEFLPGNAAIMIPKTADGRVLFGVPWHDRVVFGTTDTPVDTPSLEPRALDREREFIMTHAAQYLSRDPGEEDVLSIFAGLRPLVRSGDGGSSAALSRDHTLLVSPSGLITVAGGKWTTYRKMAEDVVDQAETVAGLDNEPCPTRTLQIHGWTQEDNDDPWLALYGSDAQAVRHIMQTVPGGETLLHSRLPYREAEVRHHIRHEMARTVEDILARRTRALLLDARASIEAAPRTAALLGEELHLDPSEQKQHIETFTQLATGYVMSP